MKFLKTISMGLLASTFLLASCGGANWDKKLKQGIVFNYSEAVTEDRETKTTFDSYYQDSILNFTSANTFNWVFSGSGIRKMIEGGTLPAGTTNASFEYSYTQVDGASFTCKAMKMRTNYRVEDISDESSTQNGVIQDNKIGIIESEGDNSVTFYFTYKK